MLVSEVGFELWLLAAILQFNVMSNFNTHCYEVVLSGSGPCSLMLQNTESSYGLGGWKGLWILTVNYESVDFCVLNLKSNQPKQECPYYIYTHTDSIYIFVYTHKQ